MATARAIWVLGPPEAGIERVLALLGRLGVPVAPERAARAAAISDALLARHGGSWQAPPAWPEGWADAAALEDLRASARALLAAPPGERPPAWGDVRLALTLPFWRALAPAPGPALVLCGGGPAGADLWRAYVESALAHAAGAPLLVVFADELDRDPDAVARLARFAEAPDDATDLRGRLEAAERARAEAVQEAGTLRARLGEQLEEVLGLRERVASVEAYWFWSQRNSAAWRLLTRYRYAVDRLLPAGTRRRRLYHFGVIGARVLATEGPRAFGRRLREALRPGRERWEDHFTGDPNTLPAGSPESYRLWVRQHRPAPAALERMREQARELGYAPLLSICMPVYNPDERYLREVLASIRAQAYESWELIVVDDGSTRPHVRSVLTEAAEADRRIQVTFKERNEGIPRTLNQAFAKARGDFVAVVDHDDVVEPHAFFEIVRFLNTRGTDWDLIYTDEAMVDGDGLPFWVAFRPDFSPEFLLSHPYFVHLVAVRRSVLEQVGGCDESFPNVSWDYDLWLRVTARTQRVGHIPKVLYLWRRYRASVSQRDRKQVTEQSTLALRRAMTLRGIEGSVEEGFRFNYFRVRPALRGEKVSIIIPSRSPDVVERCLKSLETKLAYPHREIVVVANNLEGREAEQYFDELAGRHRVLHYDQPFNFSAINNWAARQTDGAHLLFLNDDTEMIAADSVEAMLEQSQRPEIGAVGAKLLYPDDSIQHAGVLVGFFGSCDHFHKFYPAIDGGYLGSLGAIRNFSAVTAACLMTRRAVFEQVGGFDEKLRIVFNDVDLCLRIGQAGFRVVYTPYALFYHHEHASRRRAGGSLLPVGDDLLFKERWRTRLLEGDPYYNRNLSQWSYDCRPRFDTPAGG